MTSSSRSADSLVPVGVGWISPTEYGRVRRRCRVAYAGRCGFDALRRVDGLLGGRVENFGRMNRAAKLALYACGLALEDAGIDPASVPGGVGLIGANLTGCIGANEAYFRDFVANGRTTARANLFVGTLPSTALAEAAIHFGFTGPVFHIVAEDRPLAEAIRVARSLVPGQCGRAIAYGANDESAAAVIMGPPESPKEDVSGFFAEFVRKLDEWGSLEEVQRAVGHG